MFPDVPVFDSVRDGWPDRVTAWDLGKRPVRRRPSPVADVLDPETAIVASCETSEFRALVREYPDRRAAEEIAEEMHQRDLSEAAQPPVIEVTVTTPPGGIHRSELAALVNRTVAEFAGGEATNPFPAIRSGSYPPQEHSLPPLFPPAPRSSRRGKVLRAIRRVRPRRALPPGPVVEPDRPTQVLVPPSEDDVPTIMFPREPAVIEVRIP